MSDLNTIRDEIRTHNLIDETQAVANLLEASTLISDQARNEVEIQAKNWVNRLRSNGEHDLLEPFLAEYGLSNSEGIALMTLAEALLRIPDPATVDALIADKIGGKSWKDHFGASEHQLVNIASRALALTGRVIHRQDDTLDMVGGLINRMGAPVIRRAVRSAMKQMGSHFVLGETIQAAMKRAKSREAEGYTYSYDMLGEAARTDADAKRYTKAYSDAITAIAKNAKSADPRQNPGISIKLSALHPRYEYSKHATVMAELLPRARDLVRQAAAANIGLNIDAEEADRLDLSLDLIEALMSDPETVGWDGFGIVVQAYQKRAPHVINWLYTAATKYDRKIMVRLVKGAYWDTEIKRAQVLGLDGFPVYTRKPTTDLSYMVAAEVLLARRDRIYAQFGTHNAHSMAMITKLAGDKGGFEFQRLHGMGTNLHELVRKDTKAPVRIYAPVGAHQDLLAYLVRRLLENGANSSFVNQILDPDVPAAAIVADPVEVVMTYKDNAHNPRIRMPSDIYGDFRRNSQGVDWQDPVEFAELDAARQKFATSVWAGTPLIAVPFTPEDAIEITNPARSEDVVGHLIEASRETAEAAIEAAQPWDAPVKERADALRRAADLYEANTGELTALIQREAGKSIPDAIGEIREAVDFLRYYAGEAERHDDLTARGIFTCISPWNFPLAIFSGQIAAALSVGNAVLAKPAEQTGLIAHRAVQFMHEAGIPRTALQLLPGQGGTVGAALTSDSRINGVCFTGSTVTAQIIHKSIADNMAPDTPFIAETGGLNAMIVDTTALPEQAVRDVIASSFQSAGQRCSALRLVYVQDEIYDHFVDMLKGAMQALTLGDPWDISNDIGPVIDAEAAADIQAYVEAARKEKRVLAEIDAPDAGHFTAPALLSVGGIKDLPREIFGPVLHVAKFRARDLDKLTGDINARGYGLTFGLHTRIEARAEAISRAIHAGNVYVNRNQIGAIVGSQPFGGEGLSGTGPKAGGPNYLSRFSREGYAPNLSGGERGNLATYMMPGPTGELNRLSLVPKGRILCLGPNPEAVQAQSAVVLAMGATAVTAPQDFKPADLADGFAGIEGVIWWGDADTARDLRRALAKRDGPILGLMMTQDLAPYLFHERHVCIDTTAQGGNAALLAG